MNNNVSSYAKNYNGNSLMGMLKKCWRKVGLSLVYKAIQLYYVLQNPELPIQVKTIIIGSLGYLISPVDAIPDFLPGGFIDDVAVIGGAFAAANMFIDNDIRSRAGKTIDNLFGQGTSRYLTAA